MMQNDEEYYKVAPIVEQATQSLKDRIRELEAQVTELKKLLVDTDRERRKMRDALIKYANLDKWGR